MELVRSIESDFSARIEGRIEDKFKTINKVIKAISLEIKSVALKDSAGDWKYYHGVANTDGDLVARYDFTLRNVVIDKIFNLPSCLKRSRQQAIRSRGQVFL